MEVEVEVEFGGGGRSHQKPQRPEAPLGGCTMIAAFNLQFQTDNAPSPR